VARNVDPTVPNLSGKLAVVTGASDGIGFQIASRLVEAGAELIIPVRNPAKGEKAAERLRALKPGATVTTRPMDLASLDTVRAFTDQLTDEGRPVHILINNAGVMTPPTHQTTKDGWELQLGTNHLSHFVLTEGLLPLLREGKARVTNQTSIAARSGEILFDDINSDRTYDVMKAYVSSKIAVGLFGRELHRRSVAGNWGITSNVSHPGVSPTNLLSAQPGLGRPNDTAGVRMIRVLSRLGIAGTPTSAAMPAVVAATHPLAKGDQFFGPRRTIGGPAAEIDWWTPLADLDAARKIWEVSQDLVGVRFPA
jgi:NAD(P)-dependent dehydrogenase (short-subunit alcohol dehydrogenase family)